MANPVSTLIDTARRTGLYDPRRLAALTAGITRWGPTLAAPVFAWARANGSATAVIDDRGRMTWAELDRESTRLAESLHASGVGRGARLALMCRNHREFVALTVAAAKAGVEVVYLNTGFAAPQLADVVAREGVDALVIDDEFASLLDGSFDGVVATVDADGVAGLRSGGRRLPLRASMPLNPVLLTSGTTGTPKGARRTARPDADAATAIIREIPYRSDDVVAITSPLFHAWGLAQCALALTLGATIVVASTFDPSDTLDRIEHFDVTVLAVVPVLLARLLAADDFDDADLSSLRIVASSGSAIAAPVVEEWLRRAGPNLYNLYGSTEVGQATLATPSDLAVHPDTAGRELGGSRLAVLDDDGHPVPVGEAGRLFVGSSAHFDGYTGGGGKEVIDGLMSTGDVGRIDATGLLFVTGRADDMIVSGGENVFPQEIEDVLLADDRIVDAAVVGVADDEFGQRLAAHLVLADDADLTAADVRRLVGDRLARHKVPRDVAFVDELPRTTTGKLRRADL